MRPFEPPTRWAGGVVVLLLALLLGLTGPALAQVPVGQAVVILGGRGVIDPVVAPYVKLGLDTANSTDAPLVIILLDPPGGLVTALCAMVQAILHSNTSIVLSDKSAGASAASAEVFMTMVAQVVTMTPATHIGAAHPLILGDIDLIRRRCTPTKRLSSLRS